MASILLLIWTFHIFRLPSETYMTYSLFRTRVCPLSETASHIGIAVICWNLPYNNLTFSLSIPLQPISDKNGTTIFYNCLDLETWTLWVRTGEMPCGQTNYHRTGALITYKTVYGGSVYFKVIHRTARQSPKLLSIPMKWLTIFIIKKHKYLEIWTQRRRLW